MRGTKKISEMTKSIIQGDRSTWLSLFYSVSKDTVYTTKGDGRYHVTDLISYNTPTDIEITVERWKRL